MSTPAHSATSPAPALEVRALSRSFGGLRAVNDVSLSCETGKVHAVIGPNGVGKSTLVNLLSGDLPPSAGQVLLFGKDVTALAPHQRSLRGMGRSYQKTNVFLPFSVFENCRLAAQSRIGSSMRFFRAALSNRAVNEAAERAIGAAGLDGRAGATVSALSHGEQRQVEIAMALATDPKVLLLDEPLAGMGAEESAGIVDLLRRRARSDALNDSLDDVVDFLAAADSDAADARRDVAKLLDALPDRQRLPIVHMKLTGLSVAETARLTGMSESAVKVNVHRGLKALAAKMRSEA